MPNSLKPLGVISGAFLLYGKIFDLVIFRMKRIKLTRGKYALVDDEDYNFLNQWKWYAFKCGRKTKIYYACRTIRTHKDGKIIKRNISMHRIIMTPPRNMVIDHKDHNGLNNQKKNLKICTQIENNRNRKRKNKYCGVYKEGKKWVARITIVIGRYSRQSDAGNAYHRYKRKNG